MKNKKYLWIGVLFFLIPFVFGIEVEINVKDSFSIGEKIIFDYTFFADYDTLVEYVVSVNCSDIMPMLAVEELNLKAGVRQELIYNYIDVDETFEPQECEIKIYYSEPQNGNIEKVVLKKFALDVMPGIELEFKVCKDPKCQEESKVFVSGETIYFDYDSKINIDVIGKIDGEEINIPGSFKPETNGFFVIEYVATKDGYKTKSDYFQFGFIAEKAKPVQTNVCNVDSVCDGEENVKNCPQDCLSGGEDNICDGIIDGVCDSDCSKEQDQDCYINEKNLDDDKVIIQTSEDEFNILPYLIGLFFVMVIIIIGRKKE